MKPKTISVFALIILFAVLSAGIVFAQTGDKGTAKIPEDLQDLLEKVAREYKTEMILGTPMKTGKYRIIPVVSASFGTLIPGAENRGGVDHLSGGSVYPVGLVILSPGGADFVRIHRPFSSWILESLFSGSVGGKPSLRKIIVSALLLVPEKTLGIHILPWWVHKLLFSTGWFVLVLLVSWLCPKFTKDIALTMKDKIFRTALTGSVAFIAITGIFMFLVLSVAGIPLAILLAVFYLVLSFTGTVGLSLLLGWSLGRLCSRRWSVSAKWILPGALVLALLRLIPNLGWILWISSGIFGLGGTLLAMRRKRKQL